MKMSNSMWVACLLAAGVLATSGCSRAEPSPEAKITPAVTSEADLSLPLDAYDLDVTARSVVQTARYKLIKDCLISFGLPFKPHDTRPVTYPRNATYLGWLGAKQVQQYGYSGPPGQKREEAAAVTGIRGYVIPKRQDAVHVGTIRRYHGKAVPEGGCDGLAQRTLNGNAPGPDGKVPAKPGIYKNLYVFMDNASDLAYRDSRMKSIDERWSRCMHAAGFSYPAPGYAESDSRWSSRGGEEATWTPPTAAELRVARADERCRLQVDYSGARRAIYRDAQQKIIDANRPALDRLRTLLETRYANAVNVMK
ncbi:hypothetical protein N5079_14065 [Planotetraspora sp. A-T 1434]|uniref:hypothetical protein n=1 Tax=Planotetraspora sp. A-T 1434 TaxID=2979219 RepID=UPI0021C1C4AC|nr:hypothetical protein [Planotetraspora sp. A-T 1434]MCT9931344.1 hypothetical protein [Planotetraspora sp. A-T 1434]